MAFKNWNVRVHLKTGSVHLGQVGEESEELARCAALSKFGIPEDEDICANSARQRRMHSQAVLNTKQNAAWVRDFLGGTMTDSPFRARCCFRA